MMQLILMLVLLALAGLAALRRKRGPGVELANAVVTAFVVLIVAGSAPWNTEIPYLVWPVVAVVTASLVGLAAARSVRPRRSPEAS